MYRFFWRVVKAEALKKHRTTFHSKLVYFSMLIWPILTFAVAYFTYKPFKLSAGAEKVGYLNDNNLVIFILIGYIAHMFFHSLVQSAWGFSSERFWGTLELIYLSPASRLAFVLGNAISSLFENVWLFIIFAIMMFQFYGELYFPGIGLTVIGTITLIIPAIAWGMFLNALFLFSRDTRILFTILEEPMELFGGVKLPVAIFPLWAKIISYIFPLTYSIKILRRIFLKGEELVQLLPILALISLVTLIMIIITILLLKSGEKYAKKTGNMALF
ncbi:ABC transporter permease [Clostridium sp. D2Q-11]|uniref:Transport permease protein n=1 Tax=Anaeromonas frigoriresistens TaxID=2683708 RepID=A0A942Z7B2_9FIRM|nr:ABC transporter permease [Anaeromonas frigoriresistens]MBS4539376.1 ABC transporter permease [Anaeromonas frigoriresistens]